MLAGCSGALDPPSLVNKLRVLAVRAQVLNPIPSSQTLSDPYPGEQVMLDALVAGIDGDVDGGVTPAEVDYRWFACTPPPGSTSVRDCASSAAAMSGFLPSCNQEPSSSVCLIGANAAVSYQTSSDPVSAPSSVYVVVIVAAKPDSAGGCLLRLSRGEASGDTCVVALKTLTIQPAGIAMRNENPAVATFHILDKTGRMSDVHSTPQLLLGKSLPVTPDFGPLEPGEVFTFSWFSTQKDFDHFHSGFATKPPFESADNTYTNQSDAPGRVHFWLVLRDDRGGVDWTDGFADFAMMP